LKLKFEKKLIKETDNIINNIFKNLSSYYPQAPAAGGTPRMKNAIN